MFLYAGETKHQIIFSEKIMNIEKLQQLEAQLEKELWEHYTKFTDCHCGSTYDQHTQYSDCSSFVPIENPILNQYEKVLIELRKLKKLLASLK